MGSPTYISGPDYARDEVSGIPNISKPPVPVQQTIPAQVTTDDTLIKQISDGSWEVVYMGNIWGARTQAEAQLVLERAIQNASKDPVQAEVVTNEEEGVSIINDVLAGISTAADIYATVQTAGAPVNLVQSGTGAAVQPGVVLESQASIAANAATKGMVYSPRANCGRGGWIKRRRRRRQLLSESDYNALLRIETLKVNKNMTMAIGKALTR